MSPLSIDRTTKLLMYLISTQSFLRVHCIKPLSLCPSTSDVSLFIFFAFCGYLYTEVKLPTQRRKVPILESMHASALPPSTPFHPLPPPTPFLAKMWEWTIHKWHASDTKHHKLKGLNFNSVQLKWLEFFTLLCESINSRTFKWQFIILYYLAQK